MRFLALFFAVVAILMARVPEALATTSTLFDQDSYPYDIEYQGSSGSAGSGCVMNGLSDATDNWPMLCVKLNSADTTDCTSSETYFAGASAPLTLINGGREFQLPAVPVQGLTVSRRVYIPASGSNPGRNFARYYDSFTNGSGASISFKVRFGSPGTYPNPYSDLGSDGSTVLVTSSDGDSTLEITDTWFVTDDSDGTGDPSLLHIMQGSGATETVDYAALVPGASTSPPDGLRWEFRSLTLSPGQTLAIMSVFGQDSTRANAQAEAQYLVTAPAALTAGLTTTELGYVRNWAFCTPTTWYRDADGDGYGTSTTTQSACTQPSGYVSNSTDCNDSLATVYPGATEIYGDGIDENCNGTEVCYVDADNDNYRLTTTVTSTDTDCLDSGEAMSADLTGDCDDTSNTINPGASEQVGDQVDQNCDGVELCFIDADNDNYRLTGSISSSDTDCIDSGEAVSTDPTGECNDAEASINPGASEVTGDGIDQNCNGQEVCYVDADNDNYRLTSTITSADVDCQDNGEGLATDPAGDCDDTVGSIFPGATEVVGDQTDQSCDGLEICYVDADNDSYRLTTTVASTDTDCVDSGEGLATDPATDCNDAIALINPGVSEIAGDQVDQNCDTQETCYVDADNDNYRLSTTVASTDTDCVDSGEALSSDPTGDCNDNASTIHPGATEVPGDQTDQTCDGQEICYVDADNDNYRLTTTVTSTDTDCVDAGEALASDPSGDCNDASASIYPGATEVVGDQVDQSCDNQEICYVDADNDNYRMATTVTSLDPDCVDSGEALATDPTGECNDYNALVNPGVTEIVGDQTDQDCNGQEICYVDVDNDLYRLTTTITSLDSDCVDSGEALLTDPTGDCNDAASTIYPGATEVVGDQVDQSCDGQELCYVDADNDNYRLTTAVISSDVDCVDWGEAPSSDPSGDCNDGVSTIYPGANEVVGDQVDQSCDGQELCHVDADNDGYRLTSTLISTDIDCADSGEALASDASGDCDDASATVHPGATEYCNGHDDDCDGVADEPQAVDVSAWYPDTDEDGFGDPDLPLFACYLPVGYTDDLTDCDDTLAEVNPDAIEFCNGIDDDCDGDVDEQDSQDVVTWYEDGDADGYGNANVVLVQCEQPAGYVDSDVDCDDTRATVYLGAIEYCNGIDDDCDTVVDEPDASDTRTWYADIDADGYGDAAISMFACQQPAGWVADATDCVDQDASTFPGADEYCDAHDDDCDGIVDEPDAIDATIWHADADADGFGDALAPLTACYLPLGHVLDATDCDDLDATAFPGATESCNGQDDDCDGTVDEPDAVGAPIWHADGDADGFGDAATSRPACAQPQGFVADATDCDDTLSTTWPGAPERCNGRDDDCDQVTDEPSALDAPTWYADGDQDSYGDASTFQIACAQPQGFVADATDCDDADPAFHPGAPESCDDPTDYNCDGAVAYMDGDQDGIPACIDCDDTDPAILPGGVERCDGVDNDCDAAIDEPDAVDAPIWYTDADQDGYGDATLSTVACQQPEGSVADGTDCDDADPAYNPGAVETCDDPNDYNCDGSVGYADLDGDGVAACNDCDDSNPSAFPGAIEVCDGADNDCDALTDEPEAVDATVWYRDADQDGYGDSDISRAACDPPKGFAALDGDCDDSDVAFNPGATESCEDPNDYNCDGSVGYADEDGDGFAACLECDDGDAAVHPGADEYCDLVDNNCDGVTDEPEAIDASVWYADADGDGYGDANQGIVSCDPVKGHLADSTDCDDQDPLVSPGATEVCDDGKDNDCDGTDEACPDTEDSGGVVDTAPITDTGKGKDPDCGCQTGNGAVPVGFLTLMLALVLGRRRRMAA